MPIPKALAKILALAALVAAVSPASYAALLEAADNVHEVAPGKLYRSGQLSPGNSGGSSGTKRSEPP